MGLAVALYAPSRACLPRKQQRACWGLQIDPFANVFAGGMLFMPVGMMTKFALPSVIVVEAPSYQ